MRRLVENLRARPESHRHIVALGLSFAITLIIAGIWATTIFPNNNSGRVILAGDSAEKNKTVAQGPVKTFSRNMAQSFSALKLQLSSLGTTFTETSYEAQPTLEVVNPNENLSNGSNN